jgi:biopolymer transport protein ExbD
MVTSDDVMAEINVTPFSDILLVLLVIFMILAALVTPAGFRKQIAAGDDPWPPPPITTVNSVDVLVSAKNRIVVDGRPSDLARIYVDMHALAVRYGRIHIALTADARSTYGVIIRILDAAKLAGLDDVGFVSS